MIRAAITQTNLDYFRKREAEERQAASESLSPYASGAHFQMAERYADMAWSLEEASDAPYKPSGLWANAAAGVALEADPPSIGADAGTIEHTPCWLNLSPDGHAHQVSQIPQHAQGRPTKERQQLRPVSTGCFEDHSRTLGNL